MKRIILLFSAFIGICALMVYINYTVFTDYASQALSKYNFPAAIHTLQYNCQLSWLHEHDTVLNQKVYTYPDTTQSSDLYQLSNQPVLVFKFSGYMCGSCVQFVLEHIKMVFPDFKDNNRIVFLYSDANPVLGADFFAKQSFLLADSLNKPLEDLNLPFIFVLDRAHLIKHLYVPDTSNPDLLDKYLFTMRRKLFGY